MQGEDDGWKVRGSNDARQESGRNEWYDLGYQGAKAKAPHCSNSTLQNPLPQQSSSSVREEEGPVGSDGRKAKAKQRKGIVDLERRCQDLGREIQVLNKRQEIFQEAIEGKLTMPDRASETMQDRIIEEIQELVHRKTEEALQIADKSMHDLWMYQK